MSEAAGGYEPAAGAFAVSRRAAVQVRQATPGDLAVVLELRLALLHESALTLPSQRLHPDARARAERLYAAQLRASGEATFLAARAEQEVGVLRVTESAGYPLLLPERYGYVSSAYVRPAARRTGVLSALLARAEQWCAARGLPEMRLHSAAGSTTAAAAWSALGFGVVEQLRVRSLG